MMRFFRHLRNKGDEAATEISKEQICLNKLAASGEENALDPAGANYLAASSAIRKKFRDRVGHDCPMCDGKKVFCPEYIGVNPDHYIKHNFK